MDSLLEGGGFELSVPRKTATVRDRLLVGSVAPAVASTRRRLTGSRSISARVRSTSSSRRSLGLIAAGPRVRIPSSPAASLRTFGLSPSWRSMDVGCTQRGKAHPALSRL